MRLDDHGNNVAHCDQKTQNFSNVDLYHRLQKPLGGTIIQQTIRLYTERCRLRCFCRPHAIRVKSKLTPLPVNNDAILSGPSVNRMPSLAIPHFIAREVAIRIIKKAFGECVAAACIEPPCDTFANAIKKDIVHRWTIALHLDVKYIPTPEKVIFQDELPVRSKLGPKRFPGLSVKQSDAMHVICVQHLNSELLGGIKRASALIYIPREPNQIRKQQQAQDRGPRWNSFVYSHCLGVEALMFRGIQVSVLTIDTNSIRCFFT